MHYNPTVPIALTLIFAAIAGWVTLCYMLADWLENTLDWSSNATAAVVLTLLFTPPILLTGFLM